MILPLALLLCTQTGEPALTRDMSDQIADLERPGRVLFEDGFENESSFARFFEVRGKEQGRVRIVSTSHTGKGALSLTAVDRAGQESGAGLSGWLGNKGYDRLNLRYYIRFDEAYDQGNLNHTGGALAAVAGTDKWRGMGTAGIRPKGDDYFMASFETWRDWGRAPAPGYSFFYTYWMDMKRDADGHYWGNMLGPAPAGRKVIERGRWTCCEVMVKANVPGRFDGELAAWIDGKLYEHYRGIRWRSEAAVLLKRFTLDIYVHQSRRVNTVLFDDVVLSTGYIGPEPPVGH